MCVEQSFLPVIAVLFIHMLLMIAINGCAVRTGLPESGPIMLKEINKMSTWKFQRNIDQVTVAHLERCQPLKNVQVSSRLPKIAIVSSSNHSNTITSTTWWSLTTIKHISSNTTRTTARVLVHKKGGACYCVSWCCRACILCTLQRAFGKSYDNNSDGNEKDSQNLIPSVAVCSMLE
jgi:hypothetical protein